MIGNRKCINLFFIVTFLLCLGSILTQHSERIDHITKVHKAQRRLLSDILLSGRCKYLYFDFGSNIGVQIRKVYEPDFYPEAPIRPYFEKYFGSVKEGRKEGCSVGFEPNMAHTERLLSLQDVYRKVGYPVVIFTDTAVDRYNGITKLVRDEADGAHKEWADGVFNWRDYSSDELGKHSYSVLSIDLSEFIHSVYKEWNTINFQNLTAMSHEGEVSHAKKGTIVAKFDIEGIELRLLPHLLAHGALCMIDYSYVEWHTFHMSKVVKSSWPGFPGLELETMINWIMQETDHCNSVIQTMDDEAYNQDGFPFPTVPTRN